MTPEKDEPILLTVGIPTYQRAAYLKEALEAILPQMAAANLERRSGVELLVLDNASLDETGEIVQEMQRAYPSIKVRYFRQHKNLGGDANMLTALQMAHGEFLCLLSDDDILLPDALSRLLFALQTHPELDAVCLNARMLASSPAQPTEPIFRMDYDVLLQTADESLLFFGSWITFISLLAFRRSTVQMEDKQQRVGTFLFQSYLFLNVLNNGVLVLKCPCVAVRDNNTGGYNFFEVFATNFWRLMIYAQEIGYSAQTIQRVMRKHLRQFLFPFLLNFKRKQMFGTLTMDYRDGIERLLKIYPRDPFLLCILIPCLLLPRRIFEVADMIRTLLKEKRFSVK